MSASRYLLTLCLCLAAGLALAAPPKKAKNRNRLVIPEVARKDVICFAMYTVQDRVLKLTAQLYPLADDESRDIRLDVKDGEHWRTVASGVVRENAYRSPKDAKAWNVLFRVEDWDSTRDWTYRVIALDGTAKYQGVIRQDPVAKNEIVVAAFTGNSNQDRRLKPDIIRNVKAQDPDLLFFSGDQSYDHRDHLAAWLLFGRQFGEIIKDRPTVAIPDDHDVGQPNLWGANGKKSKGGGCDDGGYSMPVDYVNEVQFAQTSNLPDPYDATPIQRGIGVYYTSLNIGGVDFAVIEDRKFKTGPKGVVPKMGPRPDHVDDPDYDRKAIDVPGAKLLGERQLAFLEDWASDWNGVTMKAVLSQTIFAGGAHLSHGRRVIADLDSNGWPQTGRNKALRSIRKAFAVMIAGDQHLATVIHHGVDDWRDAGVSFCVPSIVNYYPRTWLPLEDPEGGQLNPALEHTGHYTDGFGNRVTMHAYANPGPNWRAVGDPVRDGAAGHGIIRFNKSERTVTFECWPRMVDVTSGEQFAGWPVTTRQADQGEPRGALLPTLEIAGAPDPIVQVIDESNDEVVFTVRIKGTTYQPKVYRPGRYTINVTQGVRTHTVENLEAVAHENENTLSIGR